MIDKTPELADQHPEAQASDVPAAEASSASVAQMLEVFALMALHSLAESRGQSMRSLLQDMTGLSKGRIAKGKLDDLRPSTHQKIADHQQQWLKDTFKDRPEHLVRVQANIAASPILGNGKGAVLATWVHQFEHSPECVLPISKAVALVVDEVLDALLMACAEDDLERWRQILLDHLRQRGTAISNGDQPVALSATADELDACKAISTWSQAAALTSQVLDHWYIDMIAALDAEWSSQYFAGCQTMPLFPLVMGAVPANWSEPHGTSSRKRLVIRPSRQLLQFLYALTNFVRYKKWPKNPPKPSDLADVLIQHELTEEANRALIYNYFDGTTKLTFDQVYDHWVQMAQHHMLSRKPEDLPGPPFPMIMLALQWQKLFVLNKGKTLFVLDMEKYKTLWHHYRQRWDEQQAERERAVPQTGRTKGEPIVWPEWMLNQSSSSS